MAWMEHHIYPTTIAAYGQGTHTLTPPILFTPFYMSAVSNYRDPILITAYNPSTFTYGYRNLYNGVLEKYGAYTLFIGS